MSIQRGKAVITLGDIAKEIAKGEYTLYNKFCIYGPPGTGKTLLAATIAKVPSVENIVWADLEDGLATVFTAKTTSGAPFLSAADKEKIIALSIPDQTLLDPSTAALLKLDLTSLVGKTGSNALAARIMMPLIVSPKPLHFDTQQRVLVDRPNDYTVTWHLKGLGENDVLVIDSGTQLASSIFSLAVEANPNHDHGKKHWGEFTTNALAILSAIQAAKCTVIMVCHELDVEADQETNRRARTGPWFGSAPFSKKLGHYFGTLVRLYTDSQYRSLSMPTTRVSVAGKSRFNLDSSKLQTPTMLDLLGLTERSKGATNLINTGDGPKAPSNATVPTTGANRPTTNTVRGVISK